MTEYARLVLAVDSTSAKKATDDLRGLDTQSARTDKAAQAMTKSFSGLGRVIGAIGAGIAVRAIINASDQYGQMASRIRAATASTEEYTKVQDRLLQTANATFRPLQEAQEVYIRTADAIRSLGYNTDEALDITDSFSFLLVTNAASADRASSAINAYSKAIQTGKVDSESWQSILAATPTIVNDLAAATGRSGAEIRKLGIEGKLSLEALNEALRQSRDRNEELAAAMETSVADATTALSNSFQVFVGKVNETSKASGLLTDSIGELSEILQDPETIKAAQDLAAGVVGALSAIATGARETVAVVRWAADSIAAALGGAASDDIVRLEDQLETYQGMLDNPLRRLRIGGKGQAVAFFSEDEIKQNIDLTKKQIDAFWVEQEQRKPVLPDPIPAPSPEKTRLVEAEAKAVDKKAKTAKKALTDEEKAARQLITAYTNTESQLTRQIALYGQTTEVSRVRYEVENGELAKLNAGQKERLVGLASELDAKQALREIDGFRLDILRETGQARAANDLQFELDYSQKIAEYEKQGNVEALQRLETLRQIREIQASELESGTVEGVSKAPGSTGLDASVGGASSEITRLEEEAAEVEAWRTMELEKQRAFLEAKAINSEEFAERERNINTQTRDQLSKIEKAKNQAILSSSAQFFGEMAVLSQSGNKKLAAIGKASAIAEATIKGFVAVQNALAVPPYPVGLALAVSAGVAAAANVASIAGVGFAQGGYTGPGPVNQPAGTVHKGEVVWSQADIRKAGGVSAVEAMRAGQNIVNNGVVVSQAQPASSGGAGRVSNVTVNQNINVQGRPDNRTSSQMATDAGREQRRAQARFG